MKEKMQHKEDVYRELSEQYSDGEIAESLVFSSELGNAEQQREAHGEFLKLRLTARENMSEGARLRSDLYAFKLSLQDYFRSKKFVPEFSFAQQAKRYISLTNRSNSEIADNLAIHKARLSRIVNGKENPNTELMYRLEQHSGGEIPAHYWWRLFARELEYKLRTDHRKKQEEADRVNNPLSLRA
jgi:plasmid maintenance system antidote protein VapI